MFLDSDGKNSLSADTQSHNEDHLSNSIYLPSNLSNSKEYLYFS